MRGKYGRCLSKSSAWQRALAALSDTKRLNHRNAFDSIRLSLPRRPLSNLRNLRFDAENCVAQAEALEDLGSEYQANYFKHARRPPDGSWLANDNTWEVLQLFFSALQILISWHV